MEEPWAALSDRAFVAMVEQLFSHLLKILNICAHVLDDTPPGPPVKVSEFLSCQHTNPKTALLIMLPVYKNDLSKLDIGKSSRLLVLALDRCSRCSLLSCADNVAYYLHLTSSKQ